MDTSVPWLSRTWVAIALDVLIVSGGYTGALLLRFDGWVPGVFASGFRTSLPIICATYVVVGLLVHGYERDRSLSRVAAAALGSGFLIIVAGVVFDRPLPRSVLVLGTLVSAVVLIGVRALGRSDRWPSTRGGSPTDL